MSSQPCRQPECTGQRPGDVALVIRSRARDLGGFEVRRLLPAAARRMVGPFVFFDQMGPGDFAPGEGIDVRPHPHVCLATVTWLFEGALMHRDSLGSAQLIEPGAVNLMTAGRGIVHSERAGPDRARQSRLFGIQCWLALPEEYEETAPDFRHHPASGIPEVAADDAVVKVVMGEACGARSPVRTFSPALYLEVRLPEGGGFALPRTAAHDLAAYVVDGPVRVNGEPFEAGVMAVLRDGVDLRLEAEADARLVLIGGAPLGERHIWWNFVASDPARIERAKSDWRHGRFPVVPGDEEAFIPLPE